MSVFLFVHWLLHLSLQSTSLHFYSMLGACRALTMLMLSSVLCCRSISNSLCYILSTVAPKCYVCVCVYVFGWVVRRGMG
uniref:Putative secreted peptide n=1 Tax=Anopheles braziliensis TaxID=58242 RepID=A0A2M3ZV42_9DIPT